MKKGIFLLSAFTVFISSCSEKTCCVETIDDKEVKMHITKAVSGDSESQRALYIYYGDRGDEEKSLHWLNICIRNENSKCLIYRADDLVAKYKREQTENLDKLEDLSNARDLVLKAIKLENGTRRSDLTIMLKDLEELIEKDANRTKNSQSLKIAT